MKKNLFCIEDRSMKNYSIKAISAVTVALFSILLTGCVSTVKNIELLAHTTAEITTKPLSDYDLLPMFKVEAHGYTAVDETGIDWFGSDEIYANWHSHSPTILVATLIVGGVDSGEYVSFHELQSCIYPIASESSFGTIDGREGGVGSAWLCKDEGGFGPIKFTVKLLEHDSPYIPPVCADIAQLRGCKDDFVGGYLGEWSNDELRAGWPTPGTVQDFIVRLNPCEGPAICGDDNFPDYDFHFRITRMADKKIPRVNVIE